MVGLRRERENKKKEEEEKLSVNDKKIKQLPIFLFHFVSLFSFTV